MDSAMPLHCGLGNAVTKFHIQCIQIENPATYIDTGTQYVHLYMIPFIKKVYIFLGRFDFHYSVILQKFSTLLSFFK